MAETLAVEVAQFSIRVLIVAPGAFTTGIYGLPFFVSNPIPDYDMLRHASAKRFHSISGTEKGDPAKAAEAIVDVVRGEGMAKGRRWPLYLFLGNDCEDAVKAKTAKVLAVLDEWKDVTRAMNLDESV
jgi:NAD(P)-dependent dehydrogenase (short-subunit alcohol dehydrogenase family)